MTGLINSKLGKYTLVERLGQGGMAEVYKAFQPGVERFVAIKVMHNHLTDTPEFVQRFQREARSIGRLVHPNIVGVIDFDDENGRRYMVMEYIQGGTLSAYLKTDKVVPLPCTLQIVGQLADALAYAHDQGMIHRDIKPSNVMFRDSGHTQAVLMDFGMARLYEENQEELTVAGAMIGTPTYMSPEAVRGEATDERSDLYSLGVLFYEMVTGSPPYVADTPYSMMRKLENEPLPPPRSINPALPEEVEQVLLKLLAKLPEERYQTSAEFCAALLTLQAWFTNTAAPSAPSASTTPTPVVSTTPAPRPAMVSPAPSAPKAKQRKWLPLALAGLGVILVAQVTVLFLTQLGGGIQVVRAFSAASAQPALNLSVPAATPTPSKQSALRSQDSAVTATAVITANTALSRSSPMTSNPLSITISATAAITVISPLTLAVISPSQERGVLLFHNNVSSPNGDYFVEIGSVVQPPTGAHYELWLGNDQGAVLDLGPLSVHQGRISVDGRTQQNLSVEYSYALITIEADERPAATPSPQLALIGRWLSGQSAASFQSAAGA